MPSKKKILIADDDQGITDAVQMLLEEVDYSVEVATDGETIKKINTEMPDLILLDVWMSGEDGREICKFLKAQDKTKNIPVIMISATRELSQSAKEAGAEDYLAKPFQIDDLLEKVEKYTS